MRHQTSACALITSEPRSPWVASSTTPSTAKMSAMSSTFLGARRCEKQTTARMSAGAEYWITVATAAFESSTPQKYEYCVIISPKNA